MATKVEVKTTFEAARTIEPIFTGGEVSLSAGGDILASCVEEDVLLIDLKTGQRLARIEGDGEPITSLAISPAASFLVICSRSMSMQIYRLKEQDGAEGLEAELQRTLKPHNSPVVTSTIDDSGTLLATGCADGTVKVWDLTGGFTTHTFHGHGGVISSVKFFQQDVGDESKSNQLSRKRSQDGKRKPGSDLTTGRGFFLASGSEDGKIRIWDLQKRKAIASLDSHVSVVRGLDYSAETNTLLSCSRDKTIILWDCQTWKTQKVIPVLEVIEAAGFVANGAICYSGGEYGRLRLWDSISGRELTEEQEAGAETDSIVAIQHPQAAEFLLTVHVDQTLRLHSLASATEVPQSRIDPLPIIQRISGNHDEVIDLARLGSDRSLLALATNTESIRIVSLDTAPSKEKQAQSSGLDQSFGADVALLEGHSDIIICLDVDWSGHWLATGAKDNTARLWRIDPSSNSFTCVAVLSGHAESLGAIALPRSPIANDPASQDPLNHPPAFLLTGSQDRTVKRWNTSKISLTTDSSEPQTGLRALFTRVAHEKDINAIDVSPTLPIFASASQDRTIKIWSMEDGSVTGILRGHKRGVWSIRFAPKDTPLISGSDGGSSSSRGIIVSGSGDRTVKVWSLSTYTCLLTFEGHSNSVLKVVWLFPPVESPSDNDEDEAATRAPSQAKQPLIASASSDSLIKIWSPYNTSSSASALDSAGLLTTLDNHIDRVWALTSYPASSTNPYSLISGAADATITCWVDTTASTTQAAARRAEQRVELDQALQNHINAKNYREVITLCLQLNHPGRLLRVFQDVMSSSGSTENENGDANDSITGSKEVDQVLSTLSDWQLQLLLARIRDWNTNARTAPVAQTVLHCLLKNYPISRFVSLAASARRRQQQQKAAASAEDDDDNEKSSAADVLQAEAGLKSNANLKDIFRALEVYTERHYKRVEDLMDESYVVEYTLREMDEILGVELPALENGEHAGRDLDVLMT